MYEIKDFVGNVKDIDTKKRIVTGYLSTFGGEKDSYGDIVEKGAFTKTIAERGPEGKNDIWFLNQHNWGQPHGTFAVLKEDNIGLYFESKPLIDTTFSSDVLKMYEAGILKEHSFGYETLKSDSKRDAGIRYLQELKLYEGSNVTIGANRNTPFTGLKRGIKEINNEAETLYKAIRNGTFTDDTFSLLLVALKQLQLEAYELAKSEKETVFEISGTKLKGVLNRSLERDTITSIELLKALKEPEQSTQDDEPLRVIKEFNKQFLTK